MTTARVAVLTGDKAKRHSQVPGGGGHFGHFVIADSGGKRGRATSARLGDLALVGHLHHDVVGLRARAFPLFEVGMHGKEIVSQVYIKRHTDNSSSASS